MLDYKFSVKSRLLNLSRVYILGLSFQICKASSVSSLWVLAVWSILSEFSSANVTFDRNVRKCSFAIEIYPSEKEHLTLKIDGFHGLAVLFERLDKLGRVSFN